MNLIIEKYDSTLAKRLKKNYEIHDADIEDVITNTQLSKIQKHSKYWYISIHFPEYHKATRRYLNKEIHCFLLKNNTFVLINKDTYQEFQRFFSDTKSLVKKYQNTGEMFFEMIDYFATQTYSLVQTLQAKIIKVQGQVFDFHDSTDLIGEISILQRNVINFIGIISPLKITLDDIRNQEFIINGFDNQDKLEDTQDKVKKVLHTLENLKNLVNILKETNEAFINRSTNQTIKLLTTLSIAYIPATVVSSFFGMNVYFGWENEQRNRWPLVIALALILTLTSTTLILLKRKKVI